MKGKFVYVFADGSTMTDRNGYKTLAGAKSWAEAHNRIPQMKKGRKVIRIKRRKK